MTDFRENKTLEICHNSFLFMLRLKKDYNINRKSFENIGQNVL
jgi:hypothetical protein